MSIKRNMKIFVGGGVVAAALGICLASQPASAITLSHPMSMQFRDSHDHNNWNGNNRQDRNDNGWRSNRNHNNNRYFHRDRDDRARQDRDDRVRRDRDDRARRDRDDRARRDRDDR